MLQFKNEEQQPKTKALHVKSMDNLNLHIHSDIANTEQTFLPQYKIINVTKNDFTTN